MDSIREYTLVTGAGSGIGLELVKDLVGKGRPVIAHFHTQHDALYALQKSVPDGLLLCVSGDFSTTRGIATFLKRLAREKVSLHSVVHCAAVHEKKELSHVTSRELESIFSVNAYAPMLLTQEMLAAHKHLTSIVFLGTMYSFSGGSSRSVVYTASKSALIGFSRTTALNHAPHCRVNMVVPGFVDSTLLHKESTRHLLREKKLKTPLKRFVRSDEVVAMIQYLLSKESEAVTGQMFHVNGGLYFG